MGRHHGLKQHEVTDYCSPVHCSWHNVDEPCERPYICCFECGHAYRTRVHLYLAHIGRTWNVIDFKWPWRYPPAAAVWPDGLVPARYSYHLDAWYMIKQLCRPAGKIWSCPHCSHDF